MLQTCAVRLVIAAATLAVAHAAVAQPKVHYQHAGALPPGMIGGIQLERGGPLPGYFQPVEIRAPGAAQISVAGPGQFCDPMQGPITVAMLIGPVYRFRLTDIPRHEGEELYPTIELVNRLYPPVSQELKFPVPVELSQEDIEDALAGRMVTRIIYVENPRAAYAHADDPNRQRVFDTRPGDDPLAVADRLGRPIAILRIGGRSPDDPSVPDAAFLFNSPPLLCFTQRYFEERQ